MSLFVAGVCTHTELQKKHWPAQELLPTIHSTRSTDMEKPKNIDWTARINAIVQLYHDGDFFMCEREARILLDHQQLPRYYNMRCLIIIAQCVENWYESKVNIPVGCLASKFLTCK